MLYRTFPQRQYGANEYLIPCAHCRYDFLERDLTKCAGQLELVCDLCLGFGDFEPIDRGNPICLECASAYIRGDLSDDPPCSICGEPTDTASCEHCGRHTCSECKYFVRGPDEWWCNDCRVVEDYTSMIRSGVPIRAFQGLVREYEQVMERRGAEYNLAMKFRTYQDEQEKASVVPTPLPEVKWRPLTPEDSSNPLVDEYLKTQSPSYSVLHTIVKTGRHGLIEGEPWAICLGTQPVIWLDYSGPDPEHPELLWARELAKTLNLEGI